MDKNNKKIGDLRQEIDEIDKKIINLLDKRLELSLKICQEKILNNKKIYDPDREAQIIKNLFKIRTKYLSKWAINKIFKEILRNSVRQMKLKKNLS